MGFEIDLVNILIDKKSGFEPLLKTDFVII